MTDRDLPEDVRQLIHASVPTIDALEVFMLFVQHPGEAYSPAEVATRIAPAAMPEPAIVEYLTLLREQGIVSGSAEEGWVHRPAGDPRLAAAIRSLCVAYEKRPVTLVRTVYAIADAKKLQAFSDAFRLRRKDS